MLPHRHLFLKPLGLDLHGQQAGLLGRVLRIVRLEVMLGSGQLPERIPFQDIGIQVQIGKLKADRIEEIHLDQLQGAPQLDPAGGQLALPDPDLQQIGVGDQPGLHRCGGVALQGVQQLPGLRQGLHLFLQGDAQAVFLLHGSGALPALERELQLPGLHAQRGQHRGRGARVQPNLNPAYQGLMPTWLAISVTSCDSTSAQYPPRMSCGVM